MIAPVLLLARLRVRLLLARLLVGRHASLLDDGEAEDVARLVLVRGDREVVEGISGGLHFDAVRVAPVRACGAAAGAAHELDGTR